MKIKKKKTKSKGAFEIFAKTVSIQVGKAWVFWLAFSFVFLWLISGPIFKFSDTWQLIINSVSSAVTFIMVFIIQHTQNRETEILNLKLDALIESIRDADNKSINLDDLSNKDLERLENKYKRLKNKKTGE
jgi:low affinity Fe/Cu permease